jgi:hypothetical protein
LNINNLAAVYRLVVDSRWCRRFRYLLPYDADELSVLNNEFMESYTHQDKTARSLYIVRALDRYTLSRTYIYYSYWRLFIPMAYFIAVAIVKL